MSQLNRSVTRMCARILGFGLVVACTPNENAKSPEVARAESQEAMDRTLSEASDDADEHLLQMQQDTRKALAGEETGQPKQADKPKQTELKQSDVPAATAMPKESDEPKQSDKPKGDESED